MIAPYTADNPPRVLVHGAVITSRAEWLRVLYDAYGSYNPVPFRARSQWTIITAHHTRAEWRSGEGHEIIIGVWLGQDALVQNWGRGELWLPYDYRGFYHHALA